MDIAQAVNDLVLRYLSRERADVPLWTRPDAHPDPYLRAGCHPEIVERLWDQIGPTLPADCRCLVYGSPALVSPASGIVLGLGMGTQYGLRLPGPLLAEALAAGARTTTIWGVDHLMDIQQSLGCEWVFGRWLKQELTWCRLAYEQG